jgi:hypothetical protein
VICGHRFKYTESSKLWPRSWESYVVIDKSPGSSWCMRQELTDNMHWKQEIYLLSILDHLWTTRLRRTTSPWLCNELSISSSSFARNSHSNGACSNSSTTNLKMRSYKLKTGANAKDWYYLWRFSKETFLLGESLPQRLEGKMRTEKEPSLDPLVVTSSQTPHIQTMSTMRSNHRIQMTNSQAVISVQSHTHSVSSYILMELSSK